MTIMSKRWKYWFKRRRYGYGWVPVTWEGWLTLVFSVGIVILAAFQLPSVPSDAEILRYLGITALAMGNLFLITRLAAPYPRWRWGKKPWDKPDEDF
jgi:hypothetical protein